MKPQLRQGTWADGMSPLSPVPLCSNLCNVGSRAPAGSWPLLPSLLLQNLPLHLLEAIAPDLPGKVVL